MEHPSPLLEELKSEASSADGISPILSSMSSSAAMDQETGEVKEHQVQDEEQREATLPRTCSGSSKARMESPDMAPRKWRVPIVSERQRSQSLDGNDVVSIAELQLSFQNEKIATTKKADGTGPNSISLAHVATTAIPTEAAAMELNYDDDDLDLRYVSTAPLPEIRDKAKSLESAQRAAKKALAAQNRSRAETSHSDTTTRSQARSAQEPVLDRTGTAKGLTIPSERVEVDAVRFTSSLDISGQVRDVVKRMTKSVGATHKRFSTSLGRGFMSGKDAIVKRAHHKGFSLVCIREPFVGPLKTTRDVPHDIADLTPYLKAFVPMALQDCLKLYSRQMLGAADSVAEFRHTTVLFINLTGLYEEIQVPSLSDSVIAKLVHNALCISQERIYRHEGTLRQFTIDDKGAVLIAVFGIPPQTHLDDCTRGVKTVCSLRAGRNCVILLCLRS